MSDLQKLLESFVTVIVRYHGAIKSSPRERGSSIATPTEPELEIITSLMQEPMDGMIARLNDLITESTKDVNTRRPLLEYILYGITLTRSYLDNQEIDFETMLPVMQEKLTQLIVGIQILLACSQTFQKTIKYNDTEVSMYGLSYWPMPGLCTSGTILRETVLAPLSFAEETSQDTIKKMMGNIVKQYQSSLLIKFLVEENSLLKRELADVKEELAASRQALEELHHTGEQSPGEGTSVHPKTLPPPVFFMGHKKTGFFQGVLHRLIHKKQEANSDVSTTPHSPG